MIERGCVEKIEGDVVTVRLEELEACESCVNHSCKDNRNTVLARNPDGLPLAEGDGVEILVDGASQAAAAFWVLGLPVALLFAGYGIGWMFFRSGTEIPGIVGAISGFLVGVLVGFLVQRNRKKEGLPRITRKTAVILGGGESEGPGA